MLTGLLLLYVGAVLCLNSLWMAGLIDAREIVPINLVAGAIAAAVAAQGAFGPRADAASISASAMTFLFAVTYLWVAWNRLTGADGRGLGWFSLFVAITVLPVGWREIAGAQGVFELWLGLNWLAWAGLWALYFAALALRAPVAREVAVATGLAGVLTGWVPGLLILNGLA